MTIDEATKILDDYESFGTECTHRDLPVAIKLGNEALKMTLIHRSSDRCLEDTLLPGETKE